MLQTTAKLKLWRFSKKIRQKLMILNQKNFSVSFNIFCTKTPEPELCAISSLQTNAV